MNRKNGLILGLAIVIALGTGYYTGKSLEDTGSDQASVSEQEVNEVVSESQTQRPEAKTLVFDYGSGVRIAAPKQEIVLQFLREDILSLNVKPEGRTSNDTEVIGRTSFEDTPFDRLDGDSEVTLETEKIKVHYDFDTKIITVTDKVSGKVLKQVAYEAPYQNTIGFTYEGSPNFYGLKGYDAWENEADGMLRDGGVIKAGSQGYNGAPLIWTTDGYGLLYDTDGGRIDIKDQTITFKNGSKADLEMFFVFGEPNRLMANVFYISGTAPMFPKWAMGFTNSEWGLDQAELLDIVKTYRQKDFPIDNFTLDFDWKDWGADDFGEFKWNDEKFPDGASGTLKTIMDQYGIHMTGIYKPRLIIKTKDGDFTTQGEYGEAHGYFITNQKPYSEYFSGLMANDIDFAVSSAGAWYYEQTKTAYETGIVGYWNDEADEIGRNLQHLNMQKALYLGQRGFNDNRVWSINRNFYLGAQKYAYGLWSGDIDSGFESMANQRARMLSAINNGAVKWGMDTGGFNGGNPSPENYTRWMQFSAFTPIFRVHASENKQRQPWLFGDVAEASVRDVMHLRYQLIPYIYSYERQAYETGLGLVKPTFYSDPSDPSLANQTDAWFFGDSLLVAPIVEKGQTLKTIYLPKGTWIDYFTGKVYTGGQEIAYTCDAQTWSDVPLFIKENGVIASQDYMAYVGEKPVKTVYLDCYPGRSSTTFTLYDDNGETYDYEDGDYFKQDIINQEGLITLKASEGDFQPEYESVTLRLHVNKIESIRLNGVEVDTSTSTTDAYGQVYSLSLPLGQENSIAYQTN